MTDLSVTKKILTSESVMFREEGDRIWLAPNDNFGVVIEFAAETSRGK